MANVVTPKSACARARGAQCARGHNVHEGHNVRLLSRFFRAGEAAKKIDFSYIHISMEKGLVHFLAHYHFHFHMGRPLRSGLNTSEPRRNFNNKVL